MPEPALLLGTRWTQSFSRNRPQSSEVLPVVGVVVQPEDHARWPVLTPPASVWRYKYQGKRAVWLSSDVQYRTVLRLKRGTQIR